MRGMMRGMPPMRGGPMMMRGGPGGPPMQARAGPMGPGGPRDGGRMMNKRNMNNGKHIYMITVSTSIHKKYLQIKSNTLQQLSGIFHYIDVTFVLMHV